MDRILSRVYCVGICLVALALNACSTTTPIVSEWRNPAYASGSFGLVMVAGVGGDSSIRRNFEDEFVSRLRAAGLEAMPSYRIIAEATKMDQTMLKQAAQKAGADGLLFSRVVDVEQRSEYGPSYFPYTSFGIFGSHVGATWHGVGGAPRVRRYNEYVSETTLHDLRKNDIVWTGTIRATEREDAAATIRSYVETVMNALQEKNLLQGKGR